jgi:hypothetical protein
VKAEVAENSKNCRNAGDRFLARLSRRLWRRNIPIEREWENPDGTACKIHAAAHLLDRAVTPRERHAATLLGGESRAARCQLPGQRARLSHL